MIRQLIVSYVLLVAVALTAFTVPVAFTLTSQLRGDTEASVRREANTMALMLAQGDPASRAALDRLATAYADRTPGHVDVLPASGTDGTDTARWGDGALRVTVPAIRDNHIVGAVRVTYPTSDLTARLWRIWGFRAILAVGVLAVAAGLGALVARRLTCCCGSSTRWRASSATGI